MFEIMYMITVLSIYWHYPSDPQVVPKMDNQRNPYRDAKILEKMDLRMLSLGLPRILNNPKGKT